MHVCSTMYKFVQLCVSLYKYGEVLWKGFNHELNDEGLFILNRRIYRNGKSGVDGISKLWEMILKNLYLDGNHESIVLLFYRLTIIIYRRDFRTEQDNEFIQYAEEE